MSTQAEQYRWEQDAQPRSIPDGTCSQQTSQSTWASGCTGGRGGGVGGTGVSDGGGVEERVAESVAERVGVGGGRKGGGRGEPRTSATGTGTRTGTGGRIVREVRFGGVRVGWGLDVEGGCGVALCRREGCQALVWHELCFETRHDKGCFLFWRGTLQDASHLNWNGRGPAVQLAVHLSLQLAVQFGWTLYNE